MCIPRAGGAGVPRRARAGLRPPARHRAGVDGHRRLPHVLPRRGHGALGLLARPSRTPSSSRSLARRSPGVEPAPAGAGASPMRAGARALASRASSRRRRCRPTTSRSTAGSSPTAAGRRCSLLGEGDLLALARGRLRGAARSSSRRRPAMLPAVGAALDAVREGTVPVNLLPAEERRGYDEGLSLATVVLVALSALLLLVWGGSALVKDALLRRQLQAQLEAHRAAGARGEEAAGRGRPAAEGGRHPERGPGAAGHAAAEGADRADPDRRVPDGLQPARRAG